MLPVAGSALLLSAPAAWVNRVALASPPLVWIGLISYPLYLWHWPLLVFGGIIKFAPADAAGTRADLSRACCWPGATYRFVEIPFRFGRPSRRKLFSLGAGMAMVAIAGFAVIWGAASTSGCRRKSARWPACGESLNGGLTNACSISATKRAFADTCVERDRRPLVLMWGDSTAGALLPGLRKAQETRNFGIAQLTSNSCIPALNADIVSTPNCRAMNDRVFALVRQIKPDIVLLHGTWEQHLDNVAETVVALKKETNARVVVLGGVPAWRRGLPSEVLQVFHASSRADPGAFA